MILNRFIIRSVLQPKVGFRSAFTSSKDDMSKPNWVRVGLAFGTSALLWGLLFRQHSKDIQDYKTIHGLE